MGNGEDGKPIGQISSTGERGQIIRRQSGKIACVLAAGFFARWSGQVY